MRLIEEALTFDDVLLVPAYSEILPREVDLSTRVTRRIRLNVPLLSAAMDTVTEARLAITIAQEGGIGIIHKSMTIEAQAREVGRVKKFESGVIRDPITVSPNMSIREVLDLTRSRGISGVPVVVGRKAVGIGGGYTHIMPPNKKACTYSNLNAGYSASVGYAVGGMIGASSYHPGGVNVGFLDGSVKFIKDSISLQTWGSLATKSGGEVIDASSY